MLYLMTFENCSEYVESHSIAEAIEVWKTHMNMADEPEKIEVISTDEVIRFEQNKRCAEYLCGEHDAVTGQPCRATASRCYKIGYDEAIEQDEV